MASTTPTIQYWTIKQVCEALHVSPSTVWRWVKQGRFVRPVRLGPKVTRFRVGDVMAWDQAKAEEQS